MTPEEIAAQKAEEAKKANLKADEDDKGGDAENMEGEGEGGDALDVSAVVKAIESGSISIADMDAILAAVQSQKTEAEPEEDPMSQTPAPAAAPGAEAMKASDNDLAVQFAALKGENEALKGRLDAGDAEKQRTTDVSDALTRLAGRPLGADLEGRLVKFHADFGHDAFVAYVDGMTKTTGVLPDSSGKAHAFAAQDGGKDPVSMKYQDQGTEAVDQATNFSAIWRDLKERGMTRKTEEEYVAINMVTLDTI